MIASELLANLNESEYANWITAITNDTKNFDNPFAVEHNTADGPMSALIWLMHICQ